ncbi:MAG: phosphomethylpyrimidine synthase ThiC [Candidatus Omnitrophica bacterium]|nr:phosphomethylpyrimidine synthase ThiC [Candidatus Omnitrophota bacterium]MBU4590463.1 phosphomethylpyrimidine synthase ThiC [Candidatus Omnitrophota bacterium]
MTQIEFAKSNKISPEMRQVFRHEGIAMDLLKERIKEGAIVIIKNKKRKVKPCAVGEGLRTKINANLGSSQDKIDVNEEASKARTAIKYGADSVMDLSTGGDIKKLRRAILKASSVVVGTVPIYQAAIKAQKEKGHISRMSKKDILEVFEEQASDGVDFFTVHCGVTQDTVSRLKKQKRLISVVSRGGSFLVEWMALNKKENPLYEFFDDILMIAKKYDITLSLGDGMRPGSLVDATDRPQIQELIVLGELAERARKNNVQVIIEGPGHIPIDQIEANVLIQKKLCRNAPFYVLGPLVTDVAPGYDHIVGAIGGAMAAFYGADFLCYVTPSEHLRIPDKNDIKEGVIASRIAAHAADIAKRVPGALDWDRKMSRCRSVRDWNGQIKNSIDPEKSRRYRKSTMPKDKNVCTMCSNYCSMKIAEKYFK